MVADITAIAGEVSYDFLLKRHETEFRPLCSANDEPTELLLGAIWKYMKDLTMINKLKINESYYQSKYNSDEYSKDYTKPYSRQSFLDWRRGSLLRRSWEIRAAIHKKILFPASEVNLKHTPQNFHGEQISEHQINLYYR